MLNLDIEFTANAKIEFISNLTDCDFLAIHLIKSVSQSANHIIYIHFCRSEEQGKKNIKQLRFVSFQHDQANRNWQSYEQFD